MFKIDLTQSRVEAIFPNIADYPSQLIRDFKASTRTFLRRESVCIIVGGKTVES